MKKIALITLILLSSTVYAQVPHPAPLDTIMDGEREITYFYYKNWQKCFRRMYKFDNYQHSQFNLNN